MTNQFYLQRYLIAQDGVYEQALNEIRSGRKQSHWMWFIFPQIKGLGRSQKSIFYAIQTKKQAEEYLEHNRLGKRLIEISQALLDLESDDATAILGTPDDIKLKSSMTLFLSLPNTDPIFEKVLQKFFDGEQDKRTLEKI